MAVEDGGVVGVPEASDLRLGWSAGVATLRWTPLLDACVNYTLVAGDSLANLLPLQERLTNPTAEDSTPLGGGTLTLYAVHADSIVAGEGPLGH